MGEREQQLARECRHLRGEVAALEALVGRYQDELSAAAGQAPARAVTRVEEQLVERQHLHPAGWRASHDEQCAFDQVALPSADWEWVSDWRVDVTARTDESGWRYATAWSQFDDAENPPRSERTLGDRVRRRLWKRERMLIRASGLPAMLNRQLLEETRVAATEHANEKLTQQLLRANERLVELESRTRQYEAQLLRLQDVVLRLSSRTRSRSRLVSPRRFATSSRNNADVLSQTEALLDQLLSGPGLANLDLATTFDAQERRSVMVEACQQELQEAVNEFRDLVGKAEQEH